ncbi:MAG: FHA domain-containing protein [Phycisphaeraceae bacterium]|nr:FHA domain-containing protein [Phycisphaeraceae bacterium]
MNLSLVMVTAEGTSREFPVPALPVVLGRGDDAKVRIPLASVSRRHCELSVDEDDELVVRDLGSSNGTHVNGERVKSRELIPGDLLAVGPVVFVVRIDGHPKDIKPADAYASGAVSADTTPAIEGVPTWTGQAAPATQATSPKPAAQPMAPPLKDAPSVQAGGSPAQKKAKPIDEDSLLADLSESDFDIDFSDLDDDAKK